MNQTDNDKLPAWFYRPKSEAGWQRCLFTSRPDDVLVKLKISRDEVRRWLDKGWLSFDLQPVTEFDEFGDPRVSELTMVRDVVRSGLNDAQIDHLLGLLPKPCVVDPERIAFSFRYGWVVAIPPCEPDPDEIVGEHIDSWLTACGKERLLELRSRIGELLSKPDDAPSESTK